MTTPEETRDRIKKMRDRIFKESDEDPLENDSDETTQGSDKEPAIDPIEINVGETLQEKESTFKGVNFNNSIFIGLAINPKYLGCPFKGM